MSHFIGQKLPITTAAKEHLSSVVIGWNNLAELRELMSAKGCTKAQFDQAIETVGIDPHDVANYLQRYALTPENR